MQDPEARSSAPIDANAVEPDVATAVAADAPGWEEPVNLVRDDGACCLADGVCRVLDPEVCAALGGTALAAGTTCADVDRDGDGTPDVCDGCPDDAAKIAPGACGCGERDGDRDQDGTPDCYDDCPDDARKTAPGSCGCGASDRDRDQDGTPDCADDCPDDPDKTQPQRCGCGVSDSDADGDGFADCDDVCPAVADPAQADCDGDGVGDACAGEPDCNANGIPDSCDITDGDSSDVNSNGTPDECEGFRYATGAVPVAGTDVRVTFSEGFIAPVVVCAVQYDANTIPVVTRVSDVDHFGFDVRLQNPGGGAVVSDSVHWLAMEEGTWTVDGVNCEAQTTLSSVTDHNGSWAGAAQTYGHAYVQPVVAGQVMTANDASWSFFWARGNATGAPPSAADLFTGKSVAEDGDTVRDDETLGFIVFEEGHGTLGGVSFDAVLSAAAVAGIDNAPPYAVTFDQGFATPPVVALVTSAGMNGTNGGWAMLHGAAPFTTTDVGTVIDEDQIADGERSHIAEQVACVTFETTAAWAERAAPGLDLDRNGHIELDDLTLLLQAMGTECRGVCPGDIDLDGRVTPDDLARFVTSAW